MNLLKLRLSDDEFVKYLWMTNTDPIVTRLLKMMDPQLEELDEWLNVAETPESALTRIEGLENDLANSEYEVDELQEELRELKKRKISELVFDLETEISQQRSEINRVNALASDLRDEVSNAQTKEKQMAEKLGMWTIMTTE